MTLNWWDAALCRETTLSPFMWIVVVVHPSVSCHCFSCPKGLVGAGLYPSYLGAKAGCSLNIFIQDKQPIALTFNLEFSASLVCCACLRGVARMLEYQERPQSQREDKVKRSWELNLWPSCFEATVLTTLFFAPKLLDWFLAVQFTPTPAEAQ